MSVWSVNQSCLTLYDLVDYIAYQAPLSKKFSKQNTGWVALPCPLVIIFPLKPLSTTNPPSVSICSPVLDLLHKWSHTVCGLLCRLLSLSMCFQSSSTCCLKYSYSWLNNNLCCMGISQLVYPFNY